MTTRDPQETRARILLAYTGGTIGMRRTADGYRPRRGHLAKLIAAIDRFGRPDVPEFEIHEFEPLLDSSNMTPADWLRIARVLAARHDDFDGFVVIHGTDTMAFTASALSFILHDFKKPVVLTGSMIPLEETRNDGQENLLTALTLLGRHHHRLPGVYVLFGNRLLRGNRSTKFDADGFAGFASPNLPAVGTIGIDYEIDWKLAAAEYADVPGLVCDGRPHVVELREPTVAAFRLFPGMKAAYVSTLLAPPVEGLVLECFGSGNAPNRDAGFLAVLRQASERGVVIVAVTQALQGSADLSLYATGRSLLDAGVVSGYDMTPEAALAKLFFLFSIEPRLEPEAVRELVGRNLRGELTPPERTSDARRRARRKVAGLG
ncbi:MAG TPA: type I asparaginase [Thermoanaerobaculia bacterium]|nr:type I asparaginase [Thermoanaerobaculia bacterium]